MNSPTSWRCATSRIQAGSSIEFLPRGALSMPVFRSHFWGSTKSTGAVSRSGLRLLPVRNPHGDLGFRREKVGPLSVRAARNKSGFAELFRNKGLLDATRPPLRQGKVSPRLPVPPEIPRPPYADTGMTPSWSDSFQIQDEEGAECMRAAGKLAAEVRDFAGTLVKPGITTDAIDRAVHDRIISAGAYPSPLNYHNFPKSVCTSVNECICHGIPDSRPLLDGDIINIDVTVYLNGFHGDCSATFFCGKVDADAKKLVKVTKECLEKAIAICAPGVEFSKIGGVISEHAEAYKYGVVKHFVGHGVGRTFHSGPAVLHYRNKTDAGKMEVGQTFTIEPMLTVGSIKDVMWNDNWTYVTKDGSLSAQFEHTLLITPTGVEILTL